MAATAAALSRPSLVPRAGIWQWMSRLVAPTAAPIRNSAHEIASTTRRLRGFKAPSLGPNDAILYDLTLARARSRQATRNDGYGKGMIDKLVAHVVGTGIKPLSQAKDRAFRSRVHEKWLQWTDESDADGLLDWYGQQALAVRGWLEGGEMFVRLRPRMPQDKLSVPLQVQLLEPELCPHTHNTTLANGHKVRAGIEFDAIGRRVAYWFYQTRPGDLADMDVSQLRRVPAESIIHLFAPLRAGQLRGMPHLSAALVRLHGIDKFEDAVLLRNELANLFVGFLRRPGVGDAGQDIDPLTGLTASAGQDGEPLLPMEPGLMQELEPGEDLTFSDPPDVQAGYSDFIRQQLLAACASVGLPYETLTGDMSRVNDRTVRVILNDFRQRVQAWQHQIVAFQLCRPVYRAWMDRAFLSGALPIPAAYADDPSPWLAVRWTPPRVPYIHPVQDVEAQQAEIRNGFTSRSAVVSERGEDVEAIDADQRQDNERADELQLSYDSDGRRPRTGPPAPPETATPQPGVAA